jgi:hypothetical protein
MKDSPAHGPRGARLSILWANLLVRLGLVLVMVRELKRDGPGSFYELSIKLLKP